MYRIQLIPIERKENEKPLPTGYASPENLTYMLLEPMTMTVANAHRALLKTEIF